MARKKKVLKVNVMFEPCRTKEVHQAQSYEVLLPQIARSTSDRKCEQDFVEIISDKEKVK